MPRNCAKLPLPPSKCHKFVPSWIQFGQSESQDRLEAHKASGEQAGKREHGEIEKQEGVEDFRGKFDDLMGRIEDHIGEVGEEEEITGKANHHTN